MSQSSLNSHCGGQGIFAIPPREKLLSAKVMLETFKGIKGIGNEMHFDIISELQIEYSGEWFYCELDQLKLAVDNLN